MSHISKIPLILSQLPRASSRDTSAPPLGYIQNVRELARVPVEKVSIRSEHRIHYYTDPASAGADRFRMLRIRLRELRSITPIRSIVITSALPQEGKSTIALNLATALAEHGKRSVLLVDGDLRHPTVGQTLGIDTPPSLAECLEDGADPLSALRRIDPLSWYFLPSGKPRGNPTELLQSDSLADTMRKLSPHFEWILIDTPPVIPLADALSISRHTDGSLLVIRADRTPRAAVDETLGILGPDRVLGVILNGADGLNRLYCKYYGHYAKK